MVCKHCRNPCSLLNTRAIVQRPETLWVHGNTNVLKLGQSSNQYSTHFTISSLNTSANTHCSTHHTPVAHLQYNNQCGTHTATTTAEHAIQHFSPSEFFRVSEMNVLWSLMTSLKIHTLEWVTHRTILTILVLPNLIPGFHHHHHHQNHSHRPRTNKCLHPQAVPLAYYIPAHASMWTLLPCTCACKCTKYGDIIAQNRSVCVCVGGGSKQTNLMLPPCCQQPTLIC